MRDESKPLQYALVAYVRDPVGRFVEQLRSELYAEHAHLAAHVTILPPRDLSGTEDESVRHLLVLAARFTSFEIELNDVESFAPTTPTVFLRVSRSAHRFRDMHVAFNSGPLHCEEQWTYMPHLTIVKMPDLAAAENALRIARQRWTSYSGPRTAQVRELTFVRESGDGNWSDLATIALDRAVHAK
jgi:2'-5' RNA ligase